MDVLLAASMGATHASRGWPGTDTQGLREAGTAQRNGFTAVRKMPCFARPSYEKKCQSFANSAA
jgi:hypothetical protein